MATSPNRTVRVAFQCGRRMKSDHCEPEANNDKSRILSRVSADKTLVTASEICLRLAVRDDFWLQIHCGLKMHSSSK